MTSQRYPEERLLLSQVLREYGLSESTWRRALRDPIDPIPHQRIGLGDPKHARILIKRSDLERWLARRNTVARVATRDIVDDVVAAVLR